MALNRTIWIYWHQGEANAPELVKRCIASWRTRNPGWQVNVVDALSVAQYCEVGKAVNLGRADIPVQMIADLVRLHLLNRHGGVWADATLYCATPLDDCPPHRIKRASKNAIVDDELRTFIERQTCPVHKLRWKADLQSPYWVSIINILENLPNKPVD
jgi:mannosyltransferase OCH1-like enzyme